MIMAGFGGQGVMVMGQLLAYAGMLENKSVSWMPSYGPEMRGGTANCSVIISELAIGAPIVTQPTAAVIMNLPSLDKFEAAVTANGVLIVNSSLVTKPVRRDDLQAYCVPINEIASELGNIKMINMVALGALLAATGVVAKASLLKAFAQKFAAKPGILPANQTALQQGYDFVLQTRAVC